MSTFIRLAALFVFARAIFAAPAADCTGDISSLDDVADAVKCSTVNIHSFTVPAGKTLDLKLATGATVNMGEYRPGPVSALLLLLRWLLVVLTSLQRGCCWPRSMLIMLLLAYSGRRDLRGEELGWAALPSQVSTCHDPRHRPKTRS